MHYAARHDDTAAVQALLAVGPLLPRLADEGGWLPCHMAAHHGHVAALQQLLSAAPDCVTAVAEDGETLFSLAARNGHVAVLRLLLQLAPEAATAGNLAPLRAALLYGHHIAALCLLGCGSSHAVLECLASVAGNVHAPRSVQALFSVVVAEGLPLLPGEWQLVPVPCPGLGPLLPQVLAISFEQARQLVRHLPPADVQRLRAGALALAHAQRTRRVYLPPPLTHRILTLCLT